MSASLHRRAERVIALAGASLLIATSATLGATFGYLVGSQHHTALGVVFAAAALGGELLKPFAISAGFQALTTWQPIRAVACFSVGVVCVVYSLASELSLAAGARGDLMAERGGAVQSVVHAKARYETAKAELGHLPQTRPTGELQALINGILANPKAGGCVALDGPFTREHCPRVTEWKAELARAGRRAELEGVLRVAEAEVKVGQRVGSVDPLAASLAAYAEPLGWTIAPTTISPWLALIPVLFLEIGSALGLVVVRMVSEGGARAAQVAAQGPSRWAVCGAEVASLPPRQKAIADLLQRLHEHGGTLHVSTRALAGMLGVGKGTVLRVLAEASSRDLVRLRTTAKGTTILLS